MLGYIAQESQGLREPMQSWVALDGVSGPATGVLAATLSPHGTLVSYAATSQGPMSISPLEAILKPLTVRGFWLGHPEFAAKCAPAVKQAAEMVASGQVHIPVAGNLPPSRPSRKMSRMRNVGERFFLT
jgi:NADPH:quinone reductase-like Zn-dependent oxidoreductase